MGGWGTWARDSSDKLLLSFLILGMLAYNLHILHDKADTAQIQFMNGLINTAMGALITLVTGAIRNKATVATASTAEDPKTGATVGTLELKQPDGEK